MTIKAQLNTHMSISSHKLYGYTYTQSPNQSGNIDPKFIVMHYTANSSLESTTSRFMKKSAKVSAHLGIDKDGTGAQYVPFNKKAWHAGPSSFGGYTGLNKYSIGIEFVNLGYLRKASGENRYVDSYGTVHENMDVVRADSPRVGSGAVYWPLYPEEQLKAGEEAVKALLKAYPAIRDIVTHEEIDTRGWKTDPGPAFPMARFKALLGDRKNSNVKYEVIASSLNARGGPSTKFSTLSSLPRGTVVKVVARDGKWAQIKNGLWVHSSYLRIV